MRCPKCSYISFDDQVACVKCKLQLSGKNALPFQGTAIRAEPILFLKAGHSTEDHSDYEPEADYRYTEESDGADASADLYRQLESEGMEAGLARQPESEEFELSLSDAANDNESLLIAELPQIQVGGMATEPAFDLAAEENTAAFQPKPETDFLDLLEEEEPSPLELSLQEEMSSISKQARSDIPSVDSLLDDVHPLAQQAEEAFSSDTRESTPREVEQREEITSLDIESDLSYPSPPAQEDNSLDFQTEDNDFSLDFQENQDLDSLETESRGGIDFSFEIDGQISSPELQQQGTSTLDLQPHQEVFSLELEENSDRSPETEPSGIDFSLELDNQISSPELQQQGTSTLDLQSDQEVFSLDLEERREHLTLDLQLQDENPSPPAQSQDQDGPTLELEADQEIFSLDLEESRETLTLELQAEEEVHTLDLQPQDGTPSPPAQNQDGPTLELEADQEIFSLDLEESREPLAIQSPAQDSMEMDYSDYRPAIDDGEPGSENYGGSESGSARYSPDPSASNDHLFDLSDLMGNDVAGANGQQPLTQNGHALLDLDLKDQDNGIEPGYDSRITDEEEELDLSLDLDDDQI
jgi:hypothetical protein